MLTNLPSKVTTHCCGNKKMPQTWCVKWDGPHVETWHRWNPTQIESTEIVQARTGQAVNKVVNIQHGTLHESELLNLRCAFQKITQLKEWRLDWQSLQVVHVAQCALGQGSDIFVWWTCVFIYDILNLVSKLQHEQEGIIVKDPIVLQSDGGPKHLVIHEASDVRVWFSKVVAWAWIEEGCDVDNHFPWHVQQL